MPSAHAAASSFSLQMPDLPTLHQRPSWCNLRGGIDRSACIEVRISEVRRLAGCVIKHPTRRDRRGRALHLTAALPDERPARARFAHGSQRLTTGVYTISAHEINWLHGTRKPRTLAGDYRTTRANVMRTERHQGTKASRDHVKRHQGTKASRHQVTATTPSMPDSVPASMPGCLDPSVPFRFKSRITRANPYAFPADRGLDGNPNKGATRTKKIGLRIDWTQTLRIEKWTYPRRIRPVYFLICPSHDKRRNFDTSTNRHHPVSKSATNSFDLSTFRHVDMCPPLSTRRPGREHPSSRRCPQRCLKLLMVMCTKHEDRDAAIAQRWIESIPPSLIPKHRPKINQFRERYGPIFEPRTLLCPRCLGVKYGNNPETVRQGWRRRNGKEDTGLRRRKRVSDIGMSWRESDKGTEGQSDKVKSWRESDKGTEGQRDKVKSGRESDRGTEGQSDKVKSGTTSPSVPVSLCPCVTSPPPSVPLSLCPSVPSRPPLLPLPIPLSHASQETYFQSRERIEGVPPHRDHLWVLNPEAWQRKKLERRKARRREYARTYNRTRGRVKARLRRARTILKGAGHDHLWPTSKFITPEHETLLLGLAEKIKTPETRDPPRRRRHRRVRSLVCALSAPSASLR